LEETTKHHINTKRRNFEPIIHDSVTSSNYDNIKHKKDNRMEEVMNSPLRFMYGMDEEIARLAASPSSQWPTLPFGTGKDVISKESNTKDLSSSFDDSISTVLSCEEWSSHQSFTARDEDYDDDDDTVKEQDYDGDEENDNNEKHEHDGRRLFRRDGGGDKRGNKKQLKDMYYHPRTPSRYQIPSGSPHRGKSNNDKSTKSKGRKDMFDSGSNNNSKPKLQLRLKSKLLAASLANLGSGMSPTKRTNKSKKSNNFGSPRSRMDWQKELGLPAGTTEEEAIAVLLTRELSALEL
jgi:hypothetical protein